MIDHSSEIGGGQWSSLQLAKIVGGSHREIEIEYILSDKNSKYIESLNNLKIKTYPINFSSKNLIVKFLNILKSINEAKINSNVILYGNTTEAGFWCAIFKLIFGYKYIFRLRLCPVNHFHKYIDNFIFNRADLLFANSKYVKEGILKKFGYKIYTKTYVIYNHTKFPSILAKRNRSTAVRIGLVGRFELIKRQLDMVEIAKLLSKLAPNKFIVTLIGKPDKRDFGDYFTSVTRKIDDLALSSYVKVETNANSPTEVYSELDVCVTLSKYEALSRVIFESSAEGVINFAVDSGSNGELISNNEDGILSSPDDINRIALSLADLINNFSNSYWMAEKSFSRLKEIFSYENTVKLEINLINKLLDENAITDR